MAQILSSINENIITFGKYKGETLEKLLLKPDYCKWLLKQDWFEKNHPYLYNKIKNYDVKKYFFKPIKKIEEKDPILKFVNNFSYFHTFPSKKLEIYLSDDHIKCYIFYRKIIDSLKNDILDNLTLNIKAPTSWLKKFEEKTGLKREIFKDFLESYDLANITTIIEKIRESGGFEYKGAKSFKIAKERSENQEKYWEKILKFFYGDDISSQLPFDVNRFDFIRLKAKIIYECKLSLKDFNEDQYNRYIKAADKDFTIIYLIDKDCVIDIATKIIFTIDTEKYHKYFQTIKYPSLFDKLIKNFQIIKINFIEDYFRNN